MQVSINPKIRGKGGQTPIALQLLHRLGQILVPAKAKGWIGDRRLSGENTREREMENDRERR